MPKCPNCKIELDRLNHLESVRVFNVFSLENDYERKDEWTCDEENRDQRFECHNCQEKIAYTQDDAIKFLKGEVI